MAADDYKCYVCGRSIDVKVGCCLSCEEKDPSPPDLPNSRTGELYDDFRWHS